MKHQFDLVPESFYSVECHRVDGEMKSSKETEPFQRDTHNEIKSSSPNSFPSISTAITMHSVSLEGKSTFMKE